MTATITMVMCGLLCAGAMIALLSPLRQTRLFFALAFAIALSALGLYMVMGRPGLPSVPPQPEMTQAEYRDMVLREFEFRKRLSENPDDVDALLRLAALRVVQNRNDEETLKLVERAKKLAPEDPRIPYILTAIKFR